jgi:hypothetical protein
MSKLAVAKTENIELPALPDQMLPALLLLTKALRIPREVLASDEEIAYAWRDLPRELQGIPPELRGELIARMCVAVSTGLFDGAINYVWNATILHLRKRIRDFGLPVVAQIRQADFEEKHVVELQDSELIDLSLQLNLITEDGFFFLDQCRNTRNNFSAAHPAIGKINDREFTTFLNRCVRYALSAEASPRGVDVSAFISAIRGQRFTPGQCDVWVERLNATHDAQRQLLFGTTHGIYCDPAAPEPGRLNALDLFSKCKDRLTAAMRSDIINRHSDYLAKGDTQRHVASQQFFEKLGLLNLLNESERHSVVSTAVQRLWTVHLGMNNFYNEPPFAERIKLLSDQGPIPETAQEQFVHAVVGCYIGNGYGFCWAAEAVYESTIQSFSPREVTIMIGLPRSNTVVGRRIQSGGECRTRYAHALGLIDRASVPSGSLADYDSVVNQLESGGWCYFSRKVEDLERGP